MDRSKKPKSSLASQRRFEPLDLSKSLSSLNMSSRRAATVRFAPPPLSASSAAAVTATKANSGSVSRLSQSQQAMARPATASGARPGSASGPRCRTSAGRLPEPGPKAMRRSWGVDGKEKGSGNNPAAAKVVAKTQSRSSSAPRRVPPSEKEEKPLPKRGSKIVSTTRTTETNPGIPPKTEMEGSRSPPDIARKKNTKAPNNVSLKNMDMMSPPARTSVTTIGASWDSLPSDLQNLGLEVMGYRDDAEAAAVDALKEASAAEILLRCLSAFADLASAAPELSPQQAVDEFLALHTALMTSAAVAPRDDGSQDRRAGEWLRAAAATDLAPITLYSAPPPTGSKPASPAASPTRPPTPPRRAPAAGEEAGGMEGTWLEAARRGLGEEMRAWFLGHVERLLDGDVAGTPGQLKRVNDWLDAAAAVAVRVGSGESEAVERVRRKIYGYLLDHVESAVVALNGGAAPARRK